MIKVEATWSGSFPCLCNGVWTLLVDGKDCTECIPESLRESPMGTFGTFKQKSESDYESEDEIYEDGKKKAEWIQYNKSWLNRITEDVKEQGEIFKAFQKSDWRHKSCGGCALR